MVAITVVVTKEPAPGDHITIVPHVGGVAKSEYTIIKTLTELKTLASEIDNTDSIIAQIKHVVADNPNATMAQLKTKIEAETYYC